MLEHPRTLNRPHLAREEVGALGGGADFTFTPTVRTHVEIISVTLELDTDVNVADRRVILEIGGVADVDVAIISSATQPANTIYRYSFIRGMGFWSGLVAANHVSIGLPMGLIFANPEQIRSNIFNIQAGDVINWHIIRYQEWKDPVWAG